MKQLFSTYPAGMAGIALLLFRCSMAMFLVTTASEILPLRSWLAVIVDILAIALVAGFSTRAIAALVAFASTVVLARGDCEMPLLLVAETVDAVALTLIGAGAFSVDARLYGRTTISLSR